MKSGSALSGPLLAVLLIALPDANEGAAAGDPGTIRAVPAPDLDGAEARVAGKLGAALRHVERRPESAWAWGVLALNLEAHGYVAEALVAYAHAADLEPGVFRWTYLRARLQAESGEPAAQAFEAALDLRGDYAPLRLAFGRWLADRGQLGRAREILAGIAAADAAAPRAALLLARMALAAGDPEGARRETERALSLSPGMAEAHAMRARLYRLAGDPAAAERHEALHRLLGETPPLADPVRAAVAAEGVSSAWYRRRGRVLLEQGEPERAFDELRQALAVAPTAETEDAVGLALQALGRPAEAVEHHRAALALRPALAEAAHHLGVALIASGDVSEGLAALERALELRPGLAVAALDLGTHLQRLGRLGEATEAYRRGLAAAPEEPRLLARLAWLQATSPAAGTRDGAEAVRLAREACRLTAWQLPEAIDVLAAALAESGDLAGAAARARQARELAREQGRTELARAIAGRLELYLQGRPYRLPATRS